MPPNSFHARHFPSIHHFYYLSYLYVWQKKRKEKYIQKEISEFSLSEWILLSPQVVSPWPGQLHRKVWPMRSHQAMHCTGPPGWRNAFFFPSWTSSQLFLIKSSSFSFGIVSSKLCGCSWPLPFKRSSKISTYTSFPYIKQRHFTGHLLNVNGWFMAFSMLI